VGVLLVSVILFFFLGNFRGAIIVALTIPFSLLFASICLDLNKIPANLLSLGALDFGMVVDGTVVIIENIVRHFSLAESVPKTPLDRIRDAVREVLRPVFYARAIIIAAYLPIFTLQSVEGRLFKPMAWTVSFALIGALVFSLLIAPVLALLFFSHGVHEWHNPVMQFLKDKYRIAVTRAIQHRWYRRGCVCGFVPDYFYRRYRLGIFAAPGRGSHLGSWNVGAEYWPDRRSTGDERGSRDSRFVSGSDGDDQPGWTA
jgi:cobalt-zinc-cadmium resistance protein CzcA